MFSRAAKSVVKKFGRRNYHAGESSLKNTRALVLAAERSRVPGILTPLVEQTAEKPVLNSATTSEQNGLVVSATEKNSLNEKTEHGVENEDMTLTSEAVIAGVRETPNSCESSLSQGLELPKSDAGGSLDIFRKLPVKGEPIDDANRQLRSFPVSNFTQNLGISKQKTETWRSVTKSAKILGEMGPSSYSGSCYSRADFEGWLPQLLEYYGVPDTNDTNFHGCSDYSPPSVRQRSKKIRIKSRRKKILNGRGRESTSAMGTATVDRSAQLCSTMVCRYHAPGFNQAVRKRKRRIRRAADGKRREQYGPKECRTACNYLTEGTKFGESKIRVKKSLAIGRPSCDKKSQKRFFQRCNTARENWIIPALLTDRKPNLLHSFNSEKKKLKPKPIAGVPNVLSSAKGNSMTIKSSVVKNRPQGKNLLVKKVKSNHVNYDVDRKQKPKRIPRYSITPGGKRSAVRRSSSCLLVSVSKPVDNTDDDEVFVLDVESLSTSCSHVFQSFETTSSAIEESFVINCSSELSTAVSRTIKNAGEMCQPGSRESSTKTSCCASLVFREPVIFSVESIEGGSEDGSPGVVQQRRNSISSQKIEQFSTEKFVSNTSTSLSVIPLCPFTSPYEWLDASELASGEPKDLEEKSDCKKSKKFRSGFGKRLKGLSSCGVSKRKKKCSGTKIAHFSKKSG